jgi:hypothetical protein
LDDEQEDVVLLYDVFQMISDKEKLVGGTTPGIEIRWYSLCYRGTSQPERIYEYLCKGKFVHAD